MKRFFLMFICLISLLNITFSQTYTSLNQELYLVDCTDTLYINDTEIQNLIPNNPANTQAKIPAFWFPFITGMVGTYFIYTAGAGPIAFGIVYLVKKGEKKATRRALIGCITGMIIGGTLKYIVLQSEN